MSGNAPHGAGEQHHHWIVRLSHWGQALATTIMIGSGWRIYNQEPVLPVKWRFPVELTLGGYIKDTLSRNNDPGVANAVAWHFAGMWLLVASFTALVAFGLISGHFRRDFLPVGPRSFLRDFIAAATFKLDHALGSYNAVQKAFYIGVLFALFMMLVTGIAIWKPVQTYPLEAFFGGFQGARAFHFFFMCAIVGFMAVHIMLVAIVPQTLVAMIFGRAGHAPKAPVQESAE
jgi:thiosulfate reductase cytochrome b subunit